MKITRRITSGKTLSLIIQQAHLKNDAVYGKADPDAMKNLSDIAIKILFKRKWLFESWQYLPETAPWEDLDLNILDLSFITHLIKQPAIRDKLAKTPLFHVANLYENNIPLPDEIPDKVILNYPFVTIFSNSAYTEKVFNYINHPETEIIITNPMELPEEYIPKIKNKELYYYCFNTVLKATEKIDLPEQFKQLLLKPSGAVYSKERISILLRYNFIKLDISPELMAIIFERPYKLYNFFEDKISKLDLSNVKEFPVIISDTKEE